MPIDPRAGGAIATFDPRGYQLWSTPPIPSAVFRVEEDGTLTPLPDVEWTKVERREGPNPGTADLRISLGWSAASPNYTPFAPLAKLGRAAPGTLAPDDKIAIALIRTGGHLDFIFQGYVRTPSASLGPDDRDIPIAAEGVAIREWDEPFEGALVHNASAPNSLDPEAIRQTGLDWRCNPGGDGNCSSVEIGDDGSGGGNARKYPVFLDPDVDFDEAPGEAAVRVKWTLGRLARYLMYAAPEGTYGRPVELPDSRWVDAFLEAKIPRDADDWDPDSPSTYTSDPVNVKDFSPHYAHWPATLDKLLRGHACAYAFATYTLDGKPVERLRLYRTDAAAGQIVKDLLLQEEGTPGIPNPMQPQGNQVESMRIDRDISGIQNRVKVVGRVSEVEGGFMLAPLFPILPSDVDEKDRFLKEKAEAPGTPWYDRSGYRDFGYDEGGEGHWDYAATEGDWANELGAWIKRPGSFDAIFGGPDEDGKPAYVQRLRPGTGKVITEDDRRVPRHCELCLVFDYAGPVPGVWDGTGEVYPVSGFRLLQDRLGVRITAEKPNAWHVGDYKDSEKLRCGVVPLIDWLTMTDPAKRVHLMLTTVIEGDDPTVATANKRTASPTKFTITHVLKDRQYRNRVIHPSSRFFEAPEDADPKAPIEFRDDSSQQLAQATALRAARESAPAAGMVRCPYLMTSIAIGDRLRKLTPRDIDLGGTTASDGKGIVYPRVVGLTWTNDEGGPWTEIRFEDHRAGGDAPGDGY